MRGAPRGAHAATFAAGKGPFADTLARISEDFAPWKQDPDRVEPMSMQGLGAKNGRTRVCAACNLLRSGDNQTENDVRHTDEQTNTITENMLRSGDKQTQKMI